ncbi:MAG: helix-turn-helix transcriptional regulator [Candidatus Hydrogenedentes bacterium]|nr:helix-turn-helix transcriptional regulator [Candidatus Hydrogenedentota bacterium]
MKSRYVVENNVRKYRLEAGKTQTALAAEVGVSRQTIITIEQRPVDASLSLGLRIARALARPVEEVFLLDGKFGGK